MAIALTGVSADALELGEQRSKVGHSRCIEGRSWKIKFKKLDIYSELPTNPKKKKLINRINSKNNERKTIKAAKKN